MEPISIATGADDLSPGVTPAPSERVVIVGSGNWASAIARIVGENVHHFDKFHKSVRMWCFEEAVTVNGVDRKLTDVINTTHENVKYLPKLLLPGNILADPDLTSAVTGATLIVFCIPHQFLGKLLPVIKAALGPDASSRVRAISLIKGIEFDETGLVLISDSIRRGLGITCDVLMGANVANEVAEGQFCEATVGTRGDMAMAEVWRDLFETRFFRIQLCKDAAAVELFGALKNVVALACGFAQGLDYGTNTQSALIRMGGVEMLTFVRRFYDPHAATETMLESCGMADLITTCFGGRNRKCAEAFVRSGQDWEALEVELIGGQKLQGTLTCLEVAKVLRRAGCEGEFPFFSMVHAIMTRRLPPTALVEMHLHNHPREQHVHPSHHRAHTSETMPVFQPRPSSGSLSSRATSSVSGCGVSSDSTA